MALYFLVFAVLTLFSTFEIYGLKHAESKNIFIIFCLVLFVLSFIRWESGTDWETYYAAFNQSVEWGTENEFEWGFARINEFVKIFFDNYTVLLFTLGAILFIFQSKAILKLSPYPVTSLLLLWCTSFANIFFVRQSIATAILFFAVRYIEEKKLAKFLIMIAIATLFHRTSLLFVLAWWIYPMKIRPSLMMTFILISLLLSAIISKLMGNLGAIAGGVVQQKIEIYLDSSNDTFGTEASLVQIIIKGFANKIFIFGISLFFMLRLERKGIVFREYLNLYLVGIIIYFSTISISIAFVRLSYVYDMMLILLVPIILKNIEQTYARFALFFIFVCYTGLRLYISLVGGYYDLYVPFKTIFNT
ncbi:MAG: EpsG family protein [Flavobacterium sp.]|nr:MAG: EpsG family protein [Flavobacterium sp.]